MKLIILEHYSQASEWAAKYIRNRIIQFNPGPDKYFTLGLPTGSTPLGCYQKLIEYYKNGDLSFQYVKTFNMDEYVGLPRDHPESYHSFMWNNFFKHIDIHPENTHILDGNAADLQAECDAFEEKIQAAGGIELFVGGDDPHHRRSQGLCSVQSHRGGREPHVDGVRLSAAPPHCVCV
uniref:Glucosamine-6-phosphate deaminase 1 n=1 Tax=Mus musculus TaxID=10090 RepID=A0A494BB68_MOUSE